MTNSYASSFLALAERMDNMDQDKIRTYWAMGDLIARATADGSAYIDPDGNVKTVSSRRTFVAYVIASTGYEVSFSYVQRSAKLRETFKSADVAATAYMASDVESVYDFIRSLSATAPKDADKSRKTDDGKAAKAALKALESIGKRQRLTVLRNILAELGIDPSDLV